MPVAASRRIVGVVWWPLPPSEGQSRCVPFNTWYVWPYRRREAISGPLPSAPCSTQHSTGEQEIRICAAFGEPEVVMELPPRRAVRT